MRQIATGSGLDNAGGTPLYPFLRRVPLPPPPGSSLPEKNRVIRYACLEVNCMTLTGQFVKITSRPGNL